VYSAHFCDEAVCIELSTAGKARWTWTSIAATFTEMRALHVQAMLHNGLAAANMRMNRYEEAEHDLQDALRKDDKDNNTLANMIAVNLHLGKPHQRQLTQLRMQCPEHPFLKRYSAADEEFDRSALTVT
jgi:predicted Zn-dependent protease